MTVNPLSHASSLWSSATTALTKTPDTSGLTPAPRASAGKSAAAPGARSTGTGPGGQSPFQQLSSSLQSVLLNLQASQGGAAQSASLGQAPTGGSQTPAPSYRPQAPVSDQPPGNGVSAVV